MLTIQAKDISMDYLYLKALHIIFIVTWFAGLFYIVRLFIYHTEANDKEETTKQILFNQYKIMEQRLWYIITWPSMVLTLILGPTLLFLQPAWLKQPWMHVKLSCVLLLVVYHLWCHKIFKQLKNDKITWTSGKLRMFNELATILLFAIVFLVVVKTALSGMIGVIGIVSLGILLMLGIKIYKKTRKD